MDQHGTVFAELQQTLEFHTLELAYEKKCRQLEAVGEVEKLRQLRVQTLLLEDENDDLHAQLAQDGERIDEVEGYNQELREDLEACQGSLEGVRCELRLKVREIETLKVRSEISLEVFICLHLVKAELNSLHGVTMDSTKLLTEKLTLARELSSLKPELDHLRSQASSHQSLLAEKLSLQRQLSTVQVELETEKRSTQRALAKESKSQAEDALLESQLESAQADLAKERRERQKVEREAQKTSAEAGNRVTTLESRLDAFRTKLKTTKEQLKETQLSLQKAEAPANAASVRASNQAPSWALTQRKRPAVQLDADTMIGTPGDLPAPKRSRKTSTLPGEKSTFSITPFLNRTASVAPESPPSEKAAKDDRDDVEISDSPTANSKSKPGPARASSEPANDLDNPQPTIHAKAPMAPEITKAGKANPRAGPGRKTKTATTLELVTEEDNDEVGDSNVITTQRLNSINVTDGTINEGAEVKKKKRKLLGVGLGKTLFDEDDGDALKGERGIMGGVRGFGTLAKGGLGAAKFGPRKAIAGGKSTFGAISPLKKDRKGT
ncbi:hypothetical protein P7C71_g2595, partial [Lecanoromycetidae sp. Uapishka_2]